VMEVDEALARNPLRQTLLQFASQHIQLTSSVLAVLEVDGTVSILQWPSPDAIPVFVDEIPTCNGSIALQGRVSDDDASVVFISACSSTEEAHLITVDAANCSMISHATLAFPGCGPQVSALPTLDFGAVGCNSGTIEVFATADATPM
ncbi:MAG: hypothetical protein AB1Z98_09955, partial [Nannocystaceae bacterium]